MPAMGRDWVRAAMGLARGLAPSGFPSGLPAAAILCIALNKAALCAIACIVLVPAPNMSISPMLPGMFPCMLPAAVTMGDCCVAMGDVWVTDGGVSLVLTLSLGEMGDDV